MMQCLNVSACQVIVGRYDRLARSYFVSRLAGQLRAPLLVVGEMTPCLSFLRLMLSILAVHIGSLDDETEWIGFCGIFKWS